jgi:hypothetical protein
LVQGPPGPKARERPDPKRFPGLLLLARKLEQGAASQERKIARVKGFLSTYKVELGSGGEAPPSTLSPVERFLFQTKSGYCELFATAAALLFRQMGMPSRLVTGFRAGYPTGSVLVLKDSDAHAWVEVWTRKAGWVPVDPTPVLRRPVQWFDFLSHAYDYAGAYWDRYVVDFELQRPLWRPWRMEGAARIAGAAAFLLLLGIFGRRLARRRRRRPPPRAKLAQVWRRLQKRKRFASPAGWERLESRYLQLRFGRTSPGKEEIREFRRAALAVLKGASAGAGGSESGSA